MTGTFSDGVGVVLGHAGLSVILAGARSKSPDEKGRAKALGAAATILVSCSWRGDDSGGVGTAGREPVVWTGGKVGGGPADEASRVSALLVDSGCDFRCGLAILTLALMGDGVCECSGTLLDVLARGGNGGASAFEADAVSRASKNAVSIGAIIIVRLGTTFLREAGLDGSFERVKPGKVRDSLSSILAFNGGSDRGT